MPITIQAPCQSHKTAKNLIKQGGLGGFADQELVEFANARLGTFAMPGASQPKNI
ncbi:MAG: hypothetical protein ABI770_08935 [Sphingomicrobium sp.]